LKKRKIKCRPRCLIPGLKTKRHSRKATLFSFDGFRARAFKRIFFNKIYIGKNNKTFKFLKTNEIKLRIDIIIRPARNALKPVRGKLNNLIHNSMITLTQRTMHGRRVFNVDGFVKSPKKANFKISHLMISTGYGIEI
jgi:hypothetical protein